ncbi:MAG TPA: alkyl hydroperoxide reductase [Actinomycetota bacterium]|nr:alkyl hydroperoxide reductase [Actinomycetota bacterium]
MLAAIDRELDDEAFAVVGVHSPKFPAQRDPQLVAAAVQRLGVTHPQILDPEMAITSSYGVRGWPTMVVVGPDGYVLATLPGEPEPQGLLLALRQVLGQARAQGLLNPRPLPLRPVSQDPHRFRFPGAVAAGAGRLFVADTGHNEVAALESDGAGPERLGAGLLDHPNGMAVAGRTLYVASTGDHSIRAVDLPTAAVTTVAGPPLRSPWGLAWDGRRLFIANAGTHEIWTWDPATGHATPFAGIGVEGGRDGDAREALFAQPSGLALMDGVLYVADAETSSIRAISDLDGTPRVRTVCGAGDLFGFGDRDGAGPGAELQHPIGLAAGDAVLYVADTFNHKIRRVDPVSGSCRTTFGGGGSELDPDPYPGSVLAPAEPNRPAFLEPEGLAYRRGELIVADTGNHRVLAVRVETGERRVL